MFLNVTKLPLSSDTKKWNTNQVGYTSELDNMVFQIWLRNEMAVKGGITIEEDVAHSIFDIIQG